VWKGVTTIWVRQRATRRFPKNRAIRGARLTGQGIAATHWKAKGWSQTKPMKDHGTEDGRTKNRRVGRVKIP
jgi:hypothetical protein